MTILNVTGYRSHNQERYCVLKEFIRRYETEPMDRVDAAWSDPVNQRIAASINAAFHNLISSVYSKSQRMDPRPTTFLSCSLQDKISVLSEYRQRQMGHLDWVIFYTMEKIMGGASSYI